MSINLSDPLTRLIITIIYLALCFIFGYIAKWIGSKKYFGNTFFLGFFMHIIGVIILLLVPKKKKEDLLNHYQDALNKNIITKEQYEKRIKNVK